MDMSCQRSKAFSSSTTQQANQENMFFLPLLFECKCSVQYWLLIYAVTVRIVSIQTQNKSTAAKCYLASHQCNTTTKCTALHFPCFWKLSSIVLYYMQLVHFTKVHFTKDKLPHLRKHFQLPLYILLCYIDILYVIM